MPNHQSPRSFSILRSAFRATARKMLKGKQPGRTLTIAALSLALLSMGAVYVQTGRLTRLWGRLTGMANCHNCDRKGERRTSVLIPLQGNGGTYTTIDVGGAGTGTLEGTVGFNINAAGVIEGGYIDTNNATHGFVRSAGGTLTSFDAPDAGSGSTQGTFPFSIDATGNIAGMYSDKNSVYHGFLLPAGGGSITEFDVSGAGTSGHRGTIPISINSGVITGTYVTGSASTTSVYHGFVRAANGTITTFDAPAAGTDDKQGTRPVAINSQGAITGVYSDANDQKHGFVRNPDGSITAPIDDPNGALGTYPTSIDAAGDITGTYEDASGLFHGFVLPAGGTITSFDAPGASTKGGTGKGLGGVIGTVAMSINTAGTIAGFYVDPNGVFHGFLRNANGTFVDPLDAPNAGTTAAQIQGTVALGINDSGNVSGVYADTNEVVHGFVLVPNTGGLQVTCQANNTGTVGVSFNSGPETVSGGTAPYTFSIGAGTLPSGLSLNASDGAVTGTPTASGEFTVIVTDSVGGVGAGCPITIQPGSLQITTASLPNATSGSPYSTTLAATGGSGTGYAWSVSSGSLPTGFTLSAGGVLSSTGSPAAPPNSYSFIVEVSDSGGNTATQPLTLVVNPSTSVILQENFDELTQRDAVTSAGAFTAINGTNVDIVGGAVCVSPESGNCLDMNGTGGNPQGDIESGSITLNPGVQYTLSFNLIGSQRGVTTSTTVSFGPYSQTFNLASNDDTSGIVSVPITVSSTTTTNLQFKSNTSGNIGALLDNVLITSGTGQFTTLADFTGGANGARPLYGNLIEGADGNSYGTTVGGGVYDDGTVFKVTPDGTLTTIYTFCSQTYCTDGAYPLSGLVQAGGNFYGTTEVGGANDAGTVFEITPAGQLTTLYSFCSQTGCTDGDYPYAGLVQAGGNLYGTT